MRLHNGASFALLSVEGHTVGALLNGRIAFVRANHDLLQRTVVFLTAMVLALRYCTLNATVCVCMTAHAFPSLIVLSQIVCAHTMQFMKEKLDSF